MMVNDIDELRTLLKFEGVDTTIYTDDELQVLINSKLKEIESIVGKDIKPRDRVYVTHDFYGEILELGFYPLLQIHQLYIDDIPIHPHEYNTNLRLGIIYFGGFIGAYNIRVEYTTGILDEDYRTIVMPLIKDMIAYTISFGRNNLNMGGLGYFASSLHEGDVSVSMGNSNRSVNGGVDYGYTPSINSRIDDLKKRYNYTARLKLF